MAAAAPQDSSLVCVLVVVDDEPVRPQVLEAGDLRPQVTRLHVRAQVDGHRHRDAAALEAERVEAVAEVGLDNATLALKRGDARHDGAEVRRRVAQLDRARTYAAAVSHAGRVVPWRRVGLVPLAPGLEWSP